MKFAILGILITIFLLSGVLVPYINEEYGIENTDNYSVATGEMEEASVLSMGSITLSILSMFFWTFGAIPFWLESIYLIFRIVFWFIVVDILWIG